MTAPLFINRIGLVPADNTSVQKLSQSAIWLIYTTLLEVGWMPAGSRLWTSENTLTWGSIAQDRSWILLHSPQGLVAGHSATSNVVGESTGASSSLYMLIDLLSTNSTDYSRINIQVFPEAPVSSGNSPPTGGVKGISTTGYAFMPSSLFQSRFNLQTWNSGFLFTVSTVGTNIVHTAVYAIPLYDTSISSTTNEVYPYNIIFGIYYDNSLNNMSPLMFDVVSTGLNLILNIDGTAGIPQVITAGRYDQQQNYQIVGKGFAGGNYFGDQVDSEIHIWNQSAVSPCIIGKLPDFLCNANLLGNGSTYPKTLNGQLRPITHCIIGTLIIPATATLVAPAA